MWSQSCPMAASVEFMRSCRRNSNHSMRSQPPREPLSAPLTRVLHVVLHSLFPVPACRQRRSLALRLPALKPEPTEYFVSLADPGSHLAHVSIRLREGSGVRTLEMPVWNALYQVRNFAANIENVRAQDASGTRRRPERPRPASGRSRRLRAVRSSATTFISTAPGRSEAR